MLGGARRGNFFVSTGSCDSVRRYVFYETSKNDHGLAHDPIKSCVVPRPIGWISSVSAAGVVNLAPYSFFNLVATNPTFVMYSSCGRTAHGAKDTLTNIEQTGEFVVNMATWDQREPMLASSASLPPDVDEFSVAGLEPLPSRLVKPPRVAGAPVHLECVHHQTLELPPSVDGRNTVVFGRVVGVHIDDRMIENGQLDVRKVSPIARLGYFEYARVEHVFTMQLPRRPIG
jgi:flavin reductase (DIM6/NTAB) family NADH-FMN oxidoreductase RutF